MSFSGAPYSAWNKDTCFCVKQNSEKPIVDNITKKDPINTQFTPIVNDVLIGENRIVVGDISNINVGSVLTFESTREQKKVSAIVIQRQFYFVYFVSGVNNNYSKGTIVSTPTTFEYVRVFINLPFGSLVKIQRNNDPRGYYTSLERVGSDSSVVIRKDTAQFGATATWGKIGTHTTETVPIVGLTVTEEQYKACFVSGIETDFCQK